MPALVRYHTISRFYPLQLENILADKSSFIAIAIDISSLIYSNQFNTFVMKHTI